MKIRTVDGEPINLCEHIQIVGVLNKDKFPSEYEEHVELFCKECHKTHTVIICIN